MSTDNPQHLSFSCPQCQKRLKAPVALAGKKVACPKCTASVLVPVPTKKNVEEDEWFALDAPKATAPPAVPGSRPTIVPTTDPTSNIDSSEEEFRLAPIEPKSTFDPDKAKPSSTASSSSEAQDGNQPKRSLFDDDLPDLAPLDLPPVEVARPSKPLPIDGKTAKDKTDATAGKGTSASSDEPAPVEDLDDIDLEPLAVDPKKARGAAIPSLVGSLEELSRDEASLSEYFKPPVEEEFSFPCKVCGTLLYAQKSRVGTTTRCPDCFSEFSIPTPSIKKKSQVVKIDDQVADVRLAPIDAKSVHADRPEKGKTKEILDKAAIEVDREKEEDRGSIESFDSQRWIELILGFMRDPGIIIATIILGVFTAAWFYVLYIIGNIQGIGVMQAWILRIVLFLILSIPILGSVLMCSLAIIPMAANRKSRIDEWPIGRLGESIGEAMMIIGSILVASIPGGMLATLASSVGAHYGVGVFLTTFSIGAITPILVLSMIENNSMFEPLSKSIFKSMSMKPDAWGAMYMQSGIAFFLFVCFRLMAYNSAFWSVVFGMLFPFLCFFIANQYGVLAGRISDITEIGYEGDFSDD